MQDYQEFLEGKAEIKTRPGIEVDIDFINPMLYPFQRDIVKWALGKGSAAIFAGTGMGKTFMYLEWARLVGGTVLIVAPLSVALQTIDEAKKLSITIEYLKDGSDVHPNNIYITNYERIDNFDASLFDAVVLDESSILKNSDGAINNKLIDMFKDTTYRLCATATPSPNDIVEIGNHSEFLGYMKQDGMKATFFVYDSSGRKTVLSRPGWRVKSHAEDGFYKWLASWAVTLNYPSDLGYSDDGFILPQLNIHRMQVQYDYTPEGMLPGFNVGKGLSALEAKRIRRNTIIERNQIIADMVNNSDEQWLIWCGLNDESSGLNKLIPDSVNIEGKMKPMDKATSMLDFQSGKTRVLITKIKIAGMGMNLQNSHNMVFNGLSYSWEGYYQAIRRQWRHKQTHDVNVYIVTSTHEDVVYQTVMRKEQEAVKMTQELIKATKSYSAAELRNLKFGETNYQTDNQSGNGWNLMLGDSAERMKEIADNSIDLSVYSPPFGIEIFIYSASERDLSNSVTQDEFWDHYSYIIRENLRVQKPGTVCAVHLTDGRILKSQHGYIGVKDFTGDCIEAYIKEGWEYTGRVTVWKNPQVQAIRLKSSTLAFAQLKKDSRKLRPAMPDYLLLFKKPGDNENPVTSFERGEINTDQWIQWASPVWMDIKETNVLNARVARNNNDEKHMCPLQLDFIERCIKLWSNPGEMVFSPFAGIGSEGYEAIKYGRKFTGIELKPEYYNVASQNLSNAESLAGGDLFSWAANQENE
jgi:DNA modification methylase